MAVNSDLSGMEQVMTEPYVCNPKPLMDRLVRFLDGRHVENPVRWAESTESVLASVLRAALGVCAEEQGVALAGLKLEDGTLGFKLYCAGRLEMANQTVLRIEEAMKGLGGDA